ncbi:MAG: aldo/keto reductase, partial [Holophagales bacterium]|nr:aldo/keto reductase [Holophagales bacterium]
MPIMTIFDGYFPLGLGASRFAINDPKDEPAIERAAELVCKALDAGMDYIDVGYNYSAGAAQSVLGLAFRQTKKPFAVTVKVSNDTDKTAEEARRRVEMQLKTMGLQKAAFFVCWSVKGYDEFKKIMQSGGVYDGALKMKAEGIIDHICCSIHAPLDETTKIIESGVFEGVTLSYSLLNAAQMLPALDSAQKHGVGVAVMNPLGGGLIAQNPDFFDFARNGEESIAVSALRFAKAHPAVNILLSGISKEAELYENISAVCEEDSEQGAERHARVLKGLREIKDFCTGCDYCKGCPADIPVSAYMLRRNRLLFGCRGMYNRSEPELVKNLNLFYDVCGVAPETAENPCTRCGACEQKCTQKLPIISWLADTLSRLGKTRYSKAAR